MLENIGLNEFEAAKAEKIFFDHDRAAMRDLAKVWKPGVKSSQNKEYIELSKQLQRDLEALLTVQFEKGSEKE